MSDEQVISQTALARELDAEVRDHGQTLRALSDSRAENAGLLEENAQLRERVAILEAHIGGPGA